MDYSVRKVLAAFGFTALIFFILGGGLLIFRYANDQIGGWLGFVCAVAFLFTVVFLIILGLLETSTKGRVNDG